MSVARPSGPAQARARRAPARAALLLLPGDPAAAAPAFAAGSSRWLPCLVPPAAPGVVPAFEDLLSSRDRELPDGQRYAPAFAETACEGLRPGTSGAGRDNVSWTGEWDIDLSAVCCPVLLWHGSDDPLLPARAHRLWLSANLPSARLAVRDGEGLARSPGARSRLRPSRAASGGLGRVTLSATRGEHLRES